MAKKSKNTPWPYRIRDMYIVLGLSLMVNVVALSFIAYIWS